MVPPMAMALATLPWTTSIILVLAWTIMEEEEEGEEEEEEEEEEDAHIMVFNIGLTIIPTGLTTSLTIIPIGLTIRTTYIKVLENSLIH